MIFGNITIFRRDARLHSFSPRDWLDPTRGAAWIMAQCVSDVERSEASQPSTMHRPSCPPVQHPERNSLAQPRK